MYIIHIHIHISWFIIHIYVYIYTYTHTYRFHSPYVYVYEYTYIYMYIEIVRAYTTPWHVTPHPWRTPRIHSRLPRTPIGGRAGGFRIRAEGHYIYHIPCALCVYIYIYLFIYLLFIYYRCYICIHHVSYSLNHIPHVLYTVHEHSDTLGATFQYARQPLLPKMRSSLRRPHSTQVVKFKACQLQV